MACPRTMSTLSEAPPTVIRSTWRPRYESCGGESCDSFDFQLNVSFEEEEDGPEENLCDNLRDLDMDNNCDAGAVGDLVTVESLNALLKHFSKSAFQPSAECGMSAEILQRCLALFGRDYHYFLIDNPGGIFCGTYPPKMVVLEYEKTHPTNKPAQAAAASPSQKSESCEDSPYESLYDIKKIHDQCYKARFARCRTRFPVPVILLEGRNICRSATLSCGHEMYGRKFKDAFFECCQLLGLTADNPKPKSPEKEETSENSVKLPESQSLIYDVMRTKDKELLKTYRVSSICDLMVENKKVKYGFYVTSSEKIDKEQRYSDFKILSMPYPGCEFFTDYSKNTFCGTGLIFDWSQGFVDANLDIPIDELSNRVRIDWQLYKEWDLITLTRNYLKLLLSYLANSDGGLLVHCISGWDRTPLFISLLRLSLWADGLIHKSLEPIEILYLTLGYDWFLFSHDLPDRILKGEEILYFCFDFLKFITNEEYSIKKNKIKSPRPADDLDDSFLSSQGDNNSSRNSSGSQDSSSLVFDALGCSPESQHRPNSCDRPSTTGTQQTEGVVPLMHNKPPSSSPIPCPSRSQRPDSAMSLTKGSWQMVTGTGSLLGAITARDSVSSSQDASHDRMGRRIPTRLDRLSRVRKLFFEVYVRSASQHFQNGARTSRVSSFFMGQVAEAWGGWKS